MRALTAAILCMIGSYTAALACAVYAAVESPMLLPDLLVVEWPNEPGVPFPPHTIPTMSREHLGIGFSARETGNPVPTPFADGHPRTVGVIEGFPSLQGSTWTLVIVEAGWPFKSIRAAYAAAPGVDASLWNRGIMLHGIGTPLESGPYYVPIRPQWVGLLCNAALYFITARFTGILFASARRVRRAASGRCRYCGYRLSGPRCSECGACRRPQLRLQSRETG